MYEWYYDKMQPFFGEDNLELHYLDTDSFIFSFKPIKSLIEDSEHFKKNFDFSDLDPSHELYSEANKKVVGKIKLETAPELDLDEAVFQRVNLILLILNKTVHIVNTKASNIIINTL